MSKVKIFLFLQFLLFFALPLFAQQVDTAWVRRYNGPGDSVDYAHAIAVDTNGNVYVTGRSWGSGTHYDYATIKYAPNGDIFWVSRYNGPDNGHDEPFALVVDDSGYVYVTGRSQGPSHYLDYATIKYAPNGDTLWVRRYNGVAGNADARALVVDDSGYVYVTGTSVNLLTDLDYTTIKYAPNGDIQWVNSYNNWLGPGNGWDIASALALDHNGNVYVTGESDVDNSLSTDDWDYATVKYDRFGTQLWVARYNGFFDGLDFHTTLAVDSIGNCYVTGISEADTSISNAFDCATIKYASNGDTLWVRRYHGPGNISNVPNALAVDDSGNVYVTGSSGGLEYLTIKYAPNGDTLWVRRYNRSGSATGSANLAVDRSGNVYVTGTSFNGTSQDYTTIKYAPNGDTLWVKHYGVPGNYLNRPTDIALDDYLNVYVTGVTGDPLFVNIDFLTIKYKPLAQCPCSLRISSHSPVNLIVTDPKQDSIGVNFNTILESSSYDTTQDVNQDGEKDDVVRIPNPYVGEYKIKVVPEDTGTFSLGIRIDGNDEVILANNVVISDTDTSFTYTANMYETVRGDVNKDSKRNLTDIIFLVNYIFKGGPAPNPVELGNVNCSTGNPNLTDIIYMVNYVFKGGKAPCS